MTPSFRAERGGPSSANPAKRLTRTAIVILSLLGLAFAAHGIYRALHISGPDDTVQPVSSPAERSSPRVVSEKITMPGGSPTAAPQPDAAGREGSPPPEMPQLGTIAPTGSPADQMASAPDDGSPDTESVAMGWSAVPLPIAESPEPLSEQWEVEIQGFLAAWASAWEKTAGPNDDMETYMSFYAPDFWARGMDRTAWKQDKQKKNRNKRWIDIELSDITIQALEVKNAAEVSFFQNYRSSNYSSSAPKTLILHRGEAGWKITGIRE